MQICEENGTLIVMRAIGYVIYVGKILVPLLLIIMGAIDFFKALTSDDEKSQKDETVKFLKRIIAGLIVFFIPTFLDFAFSLVYGADEVVEDKGFTKCQNCLFHPNKSGKCSVKALGEK